LSIQTGYMKPRFSAPLLASLASLFLVSSLLFLGSAYASSSVSAVTAPVFSAAFNLSNDKGSAIEPMDANVGSHVYVVWTEGKGGIFFRANSDNGTSGSWGPPLASPPLKISSGTGGRQYPVISANGSNVYVAWTQNAAGVQQIFFSVSTDYGATFSTPKDIDGEPSLQCLTPVIASWGNDVYVAEACGSLSYVEGSSNAGVSWYPTFRYGLFHEPQLAAWGSNAYGISNQGLVVSNNNGLTWSDRTIPGNSGNPGGLPVTMSESWIAAWGNNVYAAWETKTSASMVQYVVSRDSGATFSAATELSKTLTDTWGPKIAVWGNNVYITVTVHPASGSAQNYVYVSNNQAATFGSPIAISGTSTDIGTSLNVASAGNDVFAIWGREVSSGHWVTYATYSTNNGSSFVAAPGINISNNPTGTAANANDVSTGWVMSFGSAAFACWQYQPSSTANSQIYFSSS
jgi:hypothetical protein